MFSSSEKRVLFNLNEKQEINNFEVYLFLNNMPITNHEVIDNKYILITYVTR